MIKEAEFPKIKTVDLAMKPKVIDSRLMKKDMNFSAKEMNFSKADDKKVTTKLKDIDLSLKKAGYPSKITVVKDVFKGSMDY